MRTVTILLFTACLALPAQARIIYVDDDADAPGDGQSWATAFSYLQDALMVAEAGYEIRVAQGVYKPTDFVLSHRPNLGRAESFHLKPDVVVKGGYAGPGGLDDDPDARDVAAYETVLTGDRNGDDIDANNWQWQPIDDSVRRGNRDENCWTVVTATGVDANSVLDGFTITAGHASGRSWQQPDLPDDTIYGAGMFIDSASPTVLNCTFRSNTTCGQDTETRGGAVYNIDSSPTFVNCRFLENVTFGANAASFGGAICNVDSSGAITDCTFIRNVATGFDSGYTGQAIYDSNSSPTLDNCRFEENGLDYATGPVFTEEHNSSARMIDCTFEADRSTALSINDSNTTVTNCAFANHTTAGQSSVVYIGGYSHAHLLDCVFADNSGIRGAAITTGFRSSPTIEKCTFNNNHAEDQGGAIYNSGAYYNDPNSHTRIVGCTFRSNSARQGGAIYNDNHRSLTITACTFTANTVAGHPDPSGGAIYNYVSVQNLSNCLFTGHTGPGSTMYDLWCLTDMANCTFADNISHWGSDIYVDEAHFRASGCIFSSTETPVYSYDGFVTISYSNIAGGWPGTGNIDVDPLFVSPGYWDPGSTADDANDDTWIEGYYHLKSQGGRWSADEQQWRTDDVTSPCIDAGNPLAPLGLEPFPNGGRINMGAYGGTAEASKSYFNAPPCRSQIPGDINGDCRVDFKDFCFIGMNWLRDENP